MRKVINLQMKIGEISIGDIKFDLSVAKIEHLSGIQLSYRHSDESRNPGGKGIV